MDQATEIKEPLYGRDRRQAILVLLAFLIYSLLLASRYAYSASILSIEAYYGVSHADAGWALTLFHIAYGVAQFVHTFFCKHYSRRYVLAGILLVTGALQLVQFFCPPFPSLAYLWLVCGLVQSAFWPTFIYMLSQALDERYMKKAVLAFGFSALFGKVLEYGGRALLGNDHFQFLFFGNAVLLAALGFVWLFACNKLTSGNKVPKEESNANATAGKKALPLAMIVFLTICSVLVIPANFIREGVSTWMPSILTEQFGQSDRLSLILTMALSVTALLGTYFAVGCNKFIKDYRALLLLFFGCMALFIGGAILAMRAGNTILLVISSGCAICLGSAINTVLITMLPLAMRERVNSGFLAGLINSAACLGVAASTYGMGWIADKTGGWRQVFLVLFLLTAGSVALSVVNLFFGKTQGKADS
ncbi:MAG: MFS transporter [Clostridia bacterium]|nr:MFS transporter [Clostridia bacterium]